MMKFALNEKYCWAEQLGSSDQPVPLVILLSGDDCVQQLSEISEMLLPDKIKLYSKVCHALIPGGKYIECDYMIIEQKDEDFFYSENERIRKEQNIPDGEFYHYDTPCTVANQIAMLKEAGFQNTDMVWRMENTTIIIAEKCNGNL